MRRTLPALALLLAVSAIPAVAAETKASAPPPPPPASHPVLPDPPAIPLYSADELSPKPDPAKLEKTEARGDIGRWVTQVSEPTLTVYPAPANHNTGCAVVICPGGGYGGLALDWEGHDVARWFNTVGVTGVVLKYRMPRPDVTGPQGKPLPLQDAQRAIRMVRSRAAEWGVDPKRVGIMGYSAGGHLASTAATHFDPTPATGTAQGLDSFSDRPDFALLIYPVITFHLPVAHTGSRNNLIGKDADEKLVDLYSNEQQVTKDTPPTFLAHAEDDPVLCENSILFFEACRKAKVPTELRLFPKGGHGFGLGTRGGEPAQWPAMCAAWLKAQHFLGK